VRSFQSQPALPHISVTFEPLVSRFESPAPSQTDSVISTNFSNDLTGFLQVGQVILPLAMASLIVESDTAILKKQTVLRFYLKADQTSALVGASVKLNETLANLVVLVVSRNPDS